jgi:hypothetical protein
MHQRDWMGQRSSPLSRPRQTGLRFVVKPTLFCVRDPAGAQFAKGADTVVVIGASGFRGAVATSKIIAGMYTTSPLLHGALSDIFVCADLDWLDYLRAGTYARTRDRSRKLVADIRGL